MTDKTELCRLCANFADYTNSQNLYVRKQRKLLAQIEELTGLKLKYSKELPQLVCETCHEQTVQAHQFRELCIRVQQYFATQEDNRSRHIGETSQKCAESSSSSPMEEEEEESFKFQIVKAIAKERVFAKQENEVEVVDESPHPPTNDGDDYDNDDNDNDDNDNNDDDDDNDDGKMDVNYTNNSEDVEKTSIRMQISNANTNPVGVFAFVRVMHPNTSEGNKAGTGTLRKHLIIRTQVRPFVCALCSGAFKSAVILRDHMATHTGARNFPCEMCKVTFKLRKNLVQHYRSRQHKENEKKRQRNRI